MTIAEEIRKDRESGARRLESEYKAGLLTLARQFCSDEGDAEELVNRTFSAVIEGIDEYVEQSAFFGWMCRILSNIRAKDLRRKSNEVEIADSDSVFSAVDPDAALRLYQDVDAGLLRDEIEALPSEMKETIILHYILGQPLAKVAKVLALPIGTVKSRLHYGRMALAAKLGAAAKKPGAKALLVALTLAAITALGAATSLAVVRLLSPPTAAPEQQAYNSKTTAPSTGAQMRDSLPNQSSANQSPQPSPLAFSTFHLPTPENTMNTTARSLLSASAALALASPPAYATLEQKDSSQFEYKYEMLELPTAEDLDESGANDFTGAGAWLTLGTGKNLGTISMTISGSQNLTSDKASGTAGDIWKNLGVSAAAGYTIETRLKVTECTGTAGAVLLNASYGVQNHNAWLQFYGDRITWGSNVLTNMDTSVWHTYRLVGKENIYHVYVDGVLVDDSLGNGFGHGSALNRLIFGGGGGAYAGEAQVAYLRFCKGAYAPLPAPRKASTDFPLQYEMASDDTRISTTANATDWTISGLSGATISMDGVLSVTPNGKQTYWRTTDAAWKNGVTADSAFTVEFSTQIKSCTISGGDRTLQIWTASPRATGNLIIGTNHVYWQLTSAMGDNILLDSNDNTDDKHVFRIAYDGATRHGFTIWRDGVKIGENLVDFTAYNGANYSFVRFGIPGSTSGGAFDIDYIRWDTTGAYDWKDPPKGFTIVIR